MPLSVPNDVPLFLVVPVVVLDTTDVTEDVGDVERVRVDTEDTDPAGDVDEDLVDCGLRVPEKVSREVQLPRDDEEPVLDVVDDAVAVPVRDDVLVTVTVVLIVEDADAVLVGNLLGVGCGLLLPLLVGFALEEDVDVTDIDLVGAVVLDVVEDADTDFE